VKIYLSKPRYHWISPYTILEKVMFWNKDFDAHDKKHKHIINAIEPFSVGLRYLLDKIHPEVKYVKIDYWDVWSMDCTLSPIILPMLKKLKEVKHGSGYIDFEDVPEAMRLTNTEEWDDQQVFDFYREPDLQKIQCDVHNRYDWALDEMIWAFEQLNNDDWEKQYRIVEPEIDWDEYPEDEGKTSRPLRWKVKGEWDWEGRMKHQQRIDNGLRLFGKYYQTLWD
jgi:hypothetical protein